MSEIIATKPASVPKTLPMKHKCLMYGAIALWESLKAKGVVCESNFMDVVNLDVAEQIKFLDNMIDVNYLEKEVVKPLQKARKKELADAKKPVKEKKVRAPRATKKDAATATATATEPPSVIIQTPVSYDKATEELVQELSYEKVAEPVPVPEKEEKKKKPKIRKSTEEKEEKAPKVPKEKVPKEKVPKEKKPTKKKVEEKKEEEKKVEEPQDYWMIFHNNERYWTTDENQKNGELFDNITDEDGDFGPGRVVGKIENGVVVLI